MKTTRLNEIFSIAKTDLVPLIKAICTSDSKKNYITPEPLKVIDILFHFSITAHPTFHDTHYVLLPFIINFRMN